MKELTVYQRYQLALLTLVIGLFVVLKTMRLFGVELPDDLQSDANAIWAIILVLLDVKELHNTFFPAQLGLSSTKENRDEKTVLDSAPPPGA
jgi:hypothetical protein